MRSQMAPLTSRLTMPQASSAVAEVAAVGHDVHLRHGHGHAAGHTGQAQQGLGAVQAQAEGPLGDHRRGARAQRGGHGGRRARAHEKRQHRHAEPAEHAQPDVGGAPARGLDEVLHHRRPQRAGQVVAAGADRHRDAAALDEPQRGVGHQRREAGRAAEQADEQAVHQREAGDAAGQAAQHITAAQADRADEQRQHDAETVCQPPHQHAADAEADHQRGVGQAGIGARDAELGLHRRQDDGHHVHAAAAQRHQQQRDEQPAHGIARVGGMHGPDGCESGAGADGGFPVAWVGSAGSSAGGSAGGAA